MPKESAGKGEVKIVFSLSSNGELIYGPRILQSSNPSLDEPATNAVKKAAPFPVFPDSIGQPEKRFTINIAIE